ncbi:MAG: WXG100 family type VII secretion target [Thermomicrobiales bacterium]|nr:WXG100 family type VII secretion target [Thermomicrobiales bacterium]
MTSGANYVDTAGIRTASMAFGQAAFDCENQLRKVDSALQHLLSAWEGSAQIAFRNAYEAWKAEVQDYVAFNYWIGGELDRVAGVFEQYNYEISVALSSGQN